MVGLVETVLTKLRGIRIKFDFIKGITPK